MQTNARRSAAGAAAIAVIMWLAACSGSCAVGLRPGR